MTWRPGQLLILGVIALFLLYAFRLRSELRDRLILAVLAAGGAVITVQPDVSTRIAHLIGVGRGTDLLLYLFVLFTLFHTVHSSARARRLERRLTLLAREQAIMAAGDPPTEPPVESRPSDPLSGDGPAGRAPTARQ